MMNNELPPSGTESAGDHPSIVGDVVFGSPESPVAVCTLASRTLLPELAGRPEIAVAGRVFTENVGVERMVQNLAAFDTIRFLIVCGRETRHRVGQTIVALHRSGVDDSGRVVGSDAPEPVLPNLRSEDLRAFRERITLVDMIGVIDAMAVLDRSRMLAQVPAPVRAQVDAPEAVAAPKSIVEQVVAVRDPASVWSYDPVGYFLIFVDRSRQILRVEQYTQAHRLVRIVEGRGAEEICHTIVRLEQATLLAHAAYLGRELAKAEAALAFGLDYEQDRPLSRRIPDLAGAADTDEEVTSGDGAGDRGAS